MVRTPTIGEMTVARRGHHANDAKVDSVASNRVVTVVVMVRDVIIGMDVAELRVVNSSGSVLRDAPILDHVGLIRGQVGLAQLTLARVPEVGQTLVVIEMIDGHKTVKMPVVIVPTSVHAIRSPADGNTLGNLSR